MMWAKSKAQRDEDNRPIHPTAEDDSDNSADGRSSLLHGEDSEDMMSLQDDADDSESSSHGAPTASKLDQELRTVSFGALADAQKSLKAPSRHSKQSREGDSAKLRALRDRLAELREAKGVESTKKRKRQDDERKADIHRSSKHAPAEQSSKRQVSRRRQVVEVSSNPYHARDPRFSALSGGVDEGRLKKNYAFLNDYRIQELDELKGALKKAKSDDDKHKLRREIMSRENKIKSEQDKERSQQIIRDHRKKEKEAIKQGKQPFYLKRSEQKKMAVVQKFEGMKAKDKDKAIQRRRKKESERERRAMPTERRQHT